VIAIGTDEKACKALEKSYKARVTTAVCDAKDIKQVRLQSTTPTLCDTLNSGCALYRL
jgi:hypothetical protein